MSVDRIDILKDGPEGTRRAHIWYTGSGTFANDLNKTKATGEFVKYLGTVDFVFDGEGKIVSGDEWMSNLFWKQPSMNYWYVFVLPDAIWDGLLTSPSLQGSLG